jgi:hypothetical protein
MAGFFVQLSLIFYSAKSENHGGNCSLLFHSEAYENIKNFYLTFAITVEASRQINLLSSSIFIRKSSLICSNYSSQSTYIRRVPQCLSCRRNWVSPTPEEGGTHSLKGDGVGESQNSVLFVLGRAPNYLYMPLCLDC